MTELVLAFAIIGEPVIDRSKLPVPQVSTVQYEWWIINGKLVQVELRQSPERIPASLPDRLVTPTTRCSRGVCW